MMSATENPVLVVGVYRSGTSLLCALLNQHPQVALMYECDIWNFPRALLADRFKHDWVKRVEFYNQALSRHGLVAGNDFTGLSQVRTPLDLYRAFGGRKGAAVCGEKSPFYCARLEWLHDQYPGAAFIIVWRNPVEVYRSVLKAGQTSRFFGKPGMLSRMIYLQEQVIRQAERIEQAGARVLRVDYARLVEQTEAVCRESAAFLGVPFDARMLELNKADLSAIYHSPHHAHLRRGIIERQKYTEELTPPRVARKLERYRHRWERQQAEGLKLPATPQQPEPRPIEFVYHNVVGRALTFYDSAVRAGFEFIPLPWLRAYRLFKNWVVNPPSGTADEKTSMVKEWQQHWPTILAATALLGITAFMEKHADPHLQFLLFYGILCALLALVVNLRWATVFVLASAFLPSVIQYDDGSGYDTAVVFVWNCISRFILLETLVGTLGRIRRGFSKTGDRVG